MKSPIRSISTNADTPVRRPTVVDLFAGCGGMSLGFEAAGFDIAGSIEFDPIHSLVHHYNFPYSATMCSDVSKISIDHIKENLSEKGFSSEVDVVVGGPPCQGFSQIGKRVLLDPRNRLVFEFLRVVKGLQPKYFVFENVPGIASGKHKKFLDELIREFSGIGYGIVDPFRILDSSLYGVAQRRKRLILVGYKRGLPIPVYPEATHCLNSTENGSLFLQLEDIVGSQRAIGDLQLFDAYVGNDEGIDAVKHDYDGYRESFDFIPRGSFEKCHVRTMKRKIWGHIGSNHNEVSIQRFKCTAQGETEPVSRFYKLHPKRPCHTIRAGTASDKGAYTAPRPIHYQNPRCITIREAARLHSFPDWFQFHRTIWHGFREIGNAVAPMLAKNIGEEIIRCLGASSSILEQKVLVEQNPALLGYTMNEASEYWEVPNDIIPKRKRLTA